MTSPADTTPAPRQPLAAGARHLQVGLLLGPRSVRVASLALAPGRPSRLLATGHPWLGVVTRGDEVVHLTRLADPFTQRSVRLDRTGPHHVGETDQGYLVVGLPFGSLTDLVRSRVSLLRLEPTARPADADRLVERFRRRVERRDGVRSVGFAEISASRHWAVVGPMIGADAPPGRFEVYRDRADQWRWRLRAAGGEVVAASSDSFATRAEVEAEVTWLRRHTADSPTTRLDD